MAMKLETCPIVFEVFCQISRSSILVQIGCFKSGNAIFSQISVHQSANIEDRTTKMKRVEEIHPTRVNPMYEVNWANIFFQKVSETLPTDGWTKRRLDGWTNWWTDGLTSVWIPYTPIPPSMEQGYNKAQTMCIIFARHLQWIVHNLFLSHMPLSISMVLEVYLECLEIGYVKDQCMNTTSFINPNVWHRNCAIIAMIS